MHMTEPSNPARRPYRMHGRKDAIERTRERIVAATFELHATVGPSRTTISAIAEEAGVQRHTVYAHFPDLDALYLACTAHGMRVTGMPDPAAWTSVPDAGDRFRHGYLQLAAWYRANERMLTNVLADVDPMAPSAPAVAVDPFDLRMAAIFQTLIEPWDVRPRRRPTLEAVMRHSIEFATWRSLAAGGLTDLRIAAILGGLVRGVAEGSIR